MLFTLINFFVRNFHLLRLFIIVLIINSSCVSLRFFDIQVLYPSKADIPTTIHTFYILKNDSIHSELYKALFQSFYSNLNKSLTESPFFENKTIHLSTQKHFFDSIKQTPKNLQKNQAIIKPRLGLQIENLSSGYCNFKTRYQITISSIDTTIIYDNCNINENLYINGNISYSLTDSAIIRACSDIGSIIAEKYSKRCTPFWSNEERMMFYSQNRLLKKGYLQFTENDLNGATETWEKLFQVGTPKLASMAAFNIAVICEINDDLVNCETWLQKSQEVHNRKETESYLKIIKSRKELRTSLNKQIN